LRNYYLELENDHVFNSDDYPDQRTRLKDMFPGIPEDALNLLELKAIKYKSDHRKENVDERIKELEPMVASTEYQEFAASIWWAD
jgi:hypothetical protein